MDEQAPYLTPAPKGPRNLAPDVAARPRRLSFTATEHLLPNYATVARLIRWSWMSNSATWPTTETAAKLSKGVPPF